MDEIFYRLDERLELLVEELQSRRAGEQILRMAAELAAKDEGTGE